MAIDWSTERYVRLYTRDTEDDLLLSWEAAALWHAVLRRLDESGFMEAKRGGKSLALITRIPIEVVERALPGLLEDGRLRAVIGGFVSPNYVDAQFMPRSDKARAAQTRASKKLLSRESTTVGQGAISAQGVPGAADSGNSVGQGELLRSHGVPGGDDTTGPPDLPHTRHVTSHAVTPRHAESHGVTSSHAAFSDQAVRSVKQSSQKARAMRGAVDEGAASPIAADWQPAASSVELAAQLEIRDLPLVVGEFIRFWQRNRKSVEDWDVPFQERLYQLARQRGERGQAAISSLAAKKTTWL